MHMSETRPDLFRAKGGGGGGGGGGGAFWGKTVLHIYG